MGISCLFSFRCILPIFIPFIMVTAAIGQAASTTTTLAVSPTGPVASGTVVTLTATVVSGTTSVTPGQVKFCNAAAAHCEDSALLATAQLTAAGTATFKFRPGIGSHSYQAVFVGTHSYAKSASAAVDLTVTFTGTYPTTTTITSSGSIGNYALTATVMGIGSRTVSPTGDVSFLDTTNANSSLGSAALGPGTLGESFTAGPSASAGTGPFPIAVADFNGDGIADVATVNNGSAVSVLLGKGDGSFIEEPTLPAVYPYSIAVADFNGDGIPDLVTGSYGDGTLTVFLGNGDGTFNIKSSPNVGIFLFSVVVGDFNGDGIEDIAVINNSNNGPFNLVTLLGNGDGTFTIKSNTPLTGSPETLAVGDFNGDGILDLVTEDYVTGDATVLLGNGDGTFTAKDTFAAAGGFASTVIVVADFNGDGIPDLAFGYLDGSSQNVPVFLGNGDGTFTSKSTPGLGSPVDGLTAGDFNGDGVQDLAVSNGSDVTVLLGNGDGTFTTQLPPAPNGGGAIAVGDFNGDGIPDLVAALNNSVTALLNQFTGKATATLNSVSVAGSGIQQVEARYPGDTSFSSSTSNTVPLLAAQIPTTLALSSSATTSVVGNQITLTATLAPYSEGTFSTNGETVTFYNGATSIGTGTLSSGVATLTTSSLPGGSDTLTATYSGDGNFSGSTSGNVVVAVSLIATTLQLYSTNNPSAQGAPVMLGAVLSPYYSGIYDTDGETLTFYNGTTVLGTAKLTTGVASLTVTSLPDGIDTLSAVYPGDSAFSPATSNSVAQAVNVSLPPVPNLVVAVNTDTTTGVASNCTSTPAPNCSLRDALAASGPNGGNITFSATVFAAPQTISLANGTLNIPPHTTITGPTTGSGATLANLVTVSGGGPVFTVNQFVTNTTISGLTITGGGTYQGGGILNNGTLTVSGCTISGNFAGGNGGGIANFGSMALIDSTVSANTNSAEGGLDSPPVDGGGIFNSGTLTITNSTIVNNSVSISPSGTGIANLEAAGGGIFNEGTLTMTNSVVAGNSATGTLLPGSDPESYVDAMGAGIWGGLTTGANNILSGNTSNGSNTSNVAEEDDCDTPGSPACPTNGQSGNLVGSNIPLAPLGTYGGPTRTIPPLPGSPAICGALVADIPAGVTTDQRGFPRTTTYGSNPPCVDSGAVQTNYSVAFSTEPPASVPLNTNFAAALQLSESGSPFPVSGVSIPVALASGDAGSLNVSSLTTNATGIAGSGTLQVSSTGTGDTLVAALQLTTAPPPTPLTSPISVNATSSPFDVVTASSTTTLGASATSVAIGTSVTFTATVSSALTSPAPTGTVQFYDGSTKLGAAVTLTAGSASYSTSSLAAGTHTITAVYSGDSNFSSSTSAALTEQIVMAGSTTTLTASATSVMSGTSVTFTAAVSSSLTSPAPTGTVQFYDGSTALGSAVALTAGSASYTTSSLAAGTHTITAVYSGDANFSSSTSAAVTENVEGIASVLGATSASVAPGGSVTETLTVTALGGLNEATTFACSGLPSGASCSFNPASVTGSGTTTMTLSTTGSSAVLVPESRWLAGGGTALAGIFVLLWPIRRRRWAQMLGILLLCFAFSATGCGGGGGGQSGGGGGGGSSGTPAGTYTITVTTTTGSGASAITNTLTFQLTVT